LRYPPVENCQRLRRWIARADRPSRICQVSVRRRGGVPSELGSPHYHGGFGIAFVEEHVDQRIT
jgi:hypothetical protein